MSLSEKDKNKILSLHNNERTSANPGAPALTWDPELAAGAQAWAEGGGGNGGHDGSIQNTTGENMAWGTRLAVDEGVKLWLDEKRKYHGERTGDTGEVVGHYTQMIWKMTERIGCGYAKNGNGWVLCCRYEAPGNMMGYTPFDTYDAGGNNDVGETYDDGRSYAGDEPGEDGESYETSETYSYQYSYTYETDRR